MELNEFVPDFLRQSWPGWEIDELSGPAPEWIGRVGDLVADGQISWSTPECAGLGVDTFDVPPGRHPVFAGRDSGDPARPDYRVRMVFIAFAASDELADATWEADEPGFLRIDGYACLWSEKAEQAVTAETLGRFKGTVLSADGGPWIDEIVDPGTGVNVMVFPVGDNGVSSIELLDTDEERVGLLYYTWSP